MFLWNPIFTAQFISSLSDPKNFHRANVFPQCKMKKARRDAGP
jgi:hypothetical protein